MLQYFDCGGYFECGGCFVIRLRLIHLISSQRGKKFHQNFFTPNRTRPKQALACHPVPDELFATDFRDGSRISEISSDAPMNWGSCCSCSRACFSCPNRSRAALIEHNGPCSQASCCIWLASCLVAKFKILKLSHRRGILYTWNIKFK